MGPKRKPLGQLIQQKVKIDPGSGCWNWTGFFNRGLPTITTYTETGRRPILAAKASYLAFRGQVPNEAEIRRICGNRNCVNPEHLALVTDTSLPRVAPTPLEKRLHDKVEIDRKTGCWNWTGYIQRGLPYTHISRDQRNVAAARAAYLAFIGNIPPHKDVKRTCGNLLCINPEHLKLTDDVIPLRERLLSEVVADPTTGCWEMRSYLNRFGRPRIDFRGRRTMASRLALLAFKGIEIPRDKYACHTCDNGVCINPDHLFVGSPRQNTRDAISKGRFKANYWVGATCKKGHLLSPANVVEYVGIDGYRRRRCRACMESAKKRRRPEIRKPRRRTMAPPEVRQHFTLYGPKTCRAGHEYTQDNTGWSETGGRWKHRCLKCSAERALRRYHELKAMRHPRGNRLTM